MSQQNRRKSLFWVLSWVFSFSSAMALAKMLKQNNPNIPIHILVLARSFFAFTMVLPLAVRQGFKETVTVKRKKLIALRMLISFTTIYCTYFAYQNLPLATATSIGFSGPLFSISFAILILGEAFSLRQWFYLILGYLGVLIIINPASLSFESAIIISVLANTLAGIVLNITKILTRTESTVTLILYGTSFNCLMSLVLLFVFPGYLPTTFEFIQMFFIGGLGAFSNFCNTQALRYASPTFVAPFEYTRILYAVPVGFLLFSEIPTSQTFIGSGVIVFAIYFLNRKPKVREESSVEDSIVLDSAKPTGA